MWLRIIICLVFVLSIFSGVVGQTLTKRDTLDLAVPTTIDYDLADWDTVFAVITHLGTAIDTVGLSHVDEGRWRGIYPVASLLGSYQIEYYAVYGSDTTPEFVPFSVIDTVAFHGAAAGLTKEQIAVTVRDTASNRPDIWTDQVGGTGSYKDTIMVLDEDTNTVEGVSITVRNLSGTPVAYGLTDVNGKEILNLDATTYTFSLQRIGVIQDEDTTLTISGDQTDTIWVTSYDPGASPDPDLTCIQGYNRDVGGNTDDRLTITLKPVYGDLIDTSTGEFIVHEEHYAYSDTGFFIIYVTPSGNLVSKQPTGDIDSVRYDLTVKKGYIKQFEWKNIFVPDSSGCIWLKDILD